MSTQHNEGLHVESPRNLRNSVVEEPKMPVIVLPVDYSDEMEQKRRQLADLDERLRMRVGQIERAEQRLLLLQTQLLGISVIDERVTQNREVESGPSDVFRVDAMSAQPLRMGVMPISSSPPSTIMVSSSASSIAPTPQRASLLSSDMGAVTSLSASSSMIGISTPKLVGSPASSLTPATSTFGSPTSTRLSRSVFNIRASTDVTPAKASSNNTSLSFTLLKSWFGGDKESKSVHFTIDSSQIQVCEKMPSLCTTDSEVHRVNVGGWGCNVKLVTLAAENAQNRFFKRIKLLEQLPTHPNIVRYYFHDLAEDGSACRVFTEWFHTNLADVLEKRVESGKPFSVDEMEFVLMEVVKGIEFLHSYSILHRTISPANIQVLLNEDGEISRVAIANLDTLAKVITDKVNAKGTTATDPRFLAPEVLSAKRTGAYSFPSDIWSLGLVAYSLLTLHKPWAKETKVSAITTSILCGERPPNLNEDIIAACGPHALTEYASFIEIFTECTRKSPDDRPTVSIIKQVLTTKASIAEHRRASQLNIGFTYQPRRESSTFFEQFLVIGVPIGIRKPENAQAEILFQFPSAEMRPLSHPDMVVNFCMAQARASTRVKRTNSMSNINGKLFASRDLIENSSSACIFTMMEGEELRYGVCVYFEEPVDIVPSFMSTQKVMEEAKKLPSTEVDLKRISKSTAGLSTPPIKKKNPHEVHSLVTEQPKKRRHQRTASDGSFMKQLAGGVAGDTTASMAQVSPPLPGGLGHVKFTHRCYLFFSKWPFFKLHFEVLWTILAQERLTRISVQEPKKTVAPVVASNAVLTSSSPPASSSTLMAPSGSNSSFDSSSSTDAALPPSALTVLSRASKARSVSLAPHMVEIAGSPPTALNLTLPPLPDFSGAASSSSTAQEARPPHSPSPPSDSSAVSTSVSPRSDDGSTAGSSGEAETPRDSLKEREDSAAADAPSDAPEASTVVTAPTPAKEKKDKDASSLLTPAVTTSSASPTTITTRPRKISNPKKPILVSSGDANMEPEPSEDNNMFLKMLGSYYRVPVPIQKHQTTLTLAGHAPILYTPGDVTEAVAEWCFPCMFRTLNVKSLLKLLIAVLLEEKIVMCCSDTGVLTSCVTGLTAMLRPYAWQGTFLPIVPHNMYAVLDSPIPFVVGIATKASMMPSLGHFDGVIVDLHEDTVIGRSNFPRLPNSDKLYDAFSDYAEAVESSGHASNPCKTSQADTDALSKLLAALQLWHTYLLEQLATVPSVGLDFKWSNVKDVEQVIRALPSSERDFYREFVETQHFSIVSDRLNAIVCQIRSRKDHQKQVQKLEHIFTSH